MAEEVKENEYAIRFYKQCICEHIQKCDNLDVLQFLEPFIKGYIDKNKE